jgi:hypothetical protein
LSDTSSKRVASSKKELDKDPLIQAISLFVASELDPLRKEIAKLKERLAEVEQRGLEYVGIFQRASSYRRGSVCTYEGSMWIALEDTGPNDYPGGENSKWQLSVKAGRDAKPTPAMA